MWSCAWPGLQRLYEIRPHKRKKKGNYGVSCVGLTCYYGVGARILRRSKYLFPRISLICFSVPLLPFFLSISLPLFRTPYSSHNQGFPCNLCFISCALASYPYLFLRVLRIWVVFLSRRLSAFVTFRCSVAETRHSAHKRSQYYYGARYECSVAYAAN